MTLGLWAVVLFASASPPTIIPPRDFVQYWSAARVHARGGDPYDGKQLLPHQQQAAGNPDLAEPVMLWTPPWTLPLYQPFGYLEPLPAHLAWLVIQLVCVVAAVRMTWLVYGGGPSPLWLVVPIAFVPTIWLFNFGQNTGFILLGLAGFLYLRARGYPVAAGVVGALTAIKPHLLALFGLALLLDVGTKLGRRVALGGLIALVAGSALALLVNRDIFTQYSAAMTRPHSADAPSVTMWELPLVSYHLRVQLAPDWFRIQFAPIALAAVVLVPYWWMRRTTWDWPTEVPRLTFASLLLAPYGGWVFDLVILLVPVTAVVARVSGQMKLVLLALTGLVAMYPPGLAFGNLKETIWMTPATIAWYAAVAALARAAVKSAPGDRS